MPLTWLIILSFTTTFLALELFKAGAIHSYLGFNSGQFIRMPWTLFTYPLVGICCRQFGPVIGLLFVAYWLWWAGGSLERSWGTKTYGLFFFGMSAISALGLVVGGHLTSLPTSAAGLLLPLAGVTMAFAMLNPEQEILMMLFLPLKLKYLALIDVISVFIHFGRINLLLGVFALAGCAFSYWYVKRSRLSFSPVKTVCKGDVVRIYRKRSALRLLNPLSWYTDYRDRERLKKLFGDSRRKK